MDSIIDPLFCVPYPVDLAFTTKRPRAQKSRRLAAIDVAGNILFTSIKDSWSGFIQLRDAAGHTILTMKAKFRTLHDRWQAFKGDSTDLKDLVFTLKRSAALQLHDEWFVYLAGNTEEQSFDFKITGSYSKKNYTLCKGNPSCSVIAQLTKEHKLDLSLEKQAFGATVSASCDHSFVAALIAIFHEIYGISSGLPTAVAIGIAAGAAC